MTSIRHIDTRSVGPNQDHTFLTLLESQRELLNQLGSKAASPAGSGLANQSNVSLSQKSSLANLRSKKSSLEGGAYGEPYSAPLKDHDRQTHKKRSSDASGDRLNKRRRRLSDLGNLGPSFFEENMNAMKAARRDSLLSSLGTSGHVLSGLGGYSNHFGASTHSFLRLGLGSSHHSIIRLDGIALSGHQQSFHLFDQSKPSVTETSDDDSEDNDSSVDEFAGDDESVDESVIETKTEEKRETVAVVTPSRAETMDPTKLKELLGMFTEALETSQKSQQDIHDWDRKMGLKRSHSKTMRESCRSRKKLKSMMKKQLSAVLHKKKN